MKAKKMVSLVLCAALGATLAVPHALALETAGASITVGGSKTPITGAKKVGVNLEMSMISDEMWAENGNWMEQSLQAGGVPIVRWGYDAWVFDWENEVPLHPDKYYGANNTKDAAGSMGLREFAAFCKEHGVVPFVDIPIESHDFNHPGDGPVTLQRVKDLTLSMAQYLNSCGLNEVYFDMGNEPWSTGSNKFGKIPAAYYGDLFQSFSGIIKGVNPSYKLVLQHAPDTILWKSWNSTAEAHAAGYFDAYDDHQYVFMDWNEYYDKNNDSFYSKGKAISGVEPILGECNIGWTKKIYPNEWKDGHARDLGGSLALLNALLDLIGQDFYSQIITWPSHYPSEVASPGSGVTQNPFGWFDLDAWYAGRETARFTGPAIAHAIINENVLDYTLPATSSHQKVRTFAYTTGDESVLKLIVISKLWHDQLDLSITLPRAYSHVKASVMKGDRTSSPVWDLQPDYVSHLAGNVALSGAQFQDTLPYGECAVVYTFFNDTATAAPATFSAIAPAAGGAGASTAQDFVWSPSAGATNYRLVISPSADLSSPVVDTYTGGAAHYQVMQDLLRDQTYYWTVRALNSAGDTGCSEGVLQFTTAPGRTFINDTEESYTFTGSWNAQTYAGCFANDDHSSKTAQSAAVISFNGTGADLLGVRGDWCGLMTVSLDGAPPQQIDTYAPAEHKQAVLYSVRDLAPGPHTLTVTVLGQKSPSASEAWIELDGCEIFGAPAA